MDAVEYFSDIVLPAIVEFEQAEELLARAILEGSSAHNIKSATQAAFRRGAAAAFLLHHLADVVAQQPREHMPNFQGSAKRVRKWLETQNIQLASNHLHLLEDLADAMAKPKSLEPLPFAVLGNINADENGAAKRVHDNIDDVGSVWFSGKIGSRRLRSTLVTVSELWQKNLDKSLARLDARA